MSGVSSIQWTDRTWNPVVGCTKVSQGCKNCYAKTLHDARHTAYLRGHLQTIPQYAHPFETVQTIPARIADPLRWRGPSRVFVNSMSDLFHEDVPFEFVRLVFAVAAVAPQHTFQILTKRPARMREFFTWLEAHPHRWHPLDQMHQAANTHFCAVDTTVSRADARAWDRAPHYSPERVGWPLPNVWLGVSVEHQAAADERIPLLAETPAAVRFLSMEPLLEPVELSPWLSDPSSSPVDWVIIGGESGTKARVFDLDWARRILVRCQWHGVPVFVKQLGRCPVAYENGVAVWPEAELRDRHGGDPAEWPEDLRVREFPRASPAVSLPGDER